MNAILQYLDGIASALEGMASGKTATKSSSTAKSASSSSSSSSIAASGVIEAPGVAEALDSALFTTVMQDEEEQRVSAVKKLFDDIRAELVSALFQESNGTYSSYLAQIHTQLTHFNIASTLAGLTDTDISTPADGHVLMYYLSSQPGATGVWANISRLYLLQYAMIDMAGGNNNSIGSSSKPIYWDGTTHTFKAFTSNLQAAAYKYVTTQFVQGYITHDYLPTAYAVYNYVGKIFDASGITSSATGCATGQAVYGAIQAVYTYISQQGFLTSSNVVTDGSNVSENETRIPSGNAVWEFVTDYVADQVHDYYVTAFAWYSGNSNGPKPKITRSGMSGFLEGDAIPVADASYSGVVSTAAQTFAGAKTFQNDIICQEDISASGGVTAVDDIVSSSGRIEGARLVVPASAPSTYITGKWYISIDTSAISGTTPS